jgi:hypothetical protein
MINDSTPLEGEDWYYLNRSRQVGPYSTGELRWLLAKDVIAPATLVWRQGNGGWRALQDVVDEPVAETHRKRQNWLVSVLVVTVFFCGITIVAKVPTGSELKNVVAVVPKSEHRQEVTGSIRGDNRIDITEVAISDFTRPRSVEDSSSFINSGQPSLLPQGPATRTALSPEGQLELDFWRSIAYSDDADLYRSYVRRYPSGTFADIAAAKIKELARATKQASVNKSKAEAAQKKSSIVSSKTINWKSSTKATAVKTSTPKTSGLCSNGNIERCRDRCRKGEARSCQRLKQLGG